MIDHGEVATDYAFDMLAYQTEDIADLFPGNDDTADTIDTKEALAYLASLEG
jgi:hypothetical protein